MSQLEPSGHLAHSCFVSWISDVSLLHLLFGFVFLSYWSPGFVCYYFCIISVKLQQCSFACDSSVVLLWCCIISVFVRLPVSASEAMCFFNFSFAFVSASLHLGYFGVLSFCFFKGNVQNVSQPVFEGHTHMHAHTCCTNRMRTKKPGCYWKLLRIQMRVDKTPLIKVKLKVVVRETESQRKKQGFNVNFQSGKLNIRLPEYILQCLHCCLPARTLSVW